MINDLFDNCDIVFSYKLKVIVKVVLEVVVSLFFWGWVGGGVVGII